MSDFYTVTIFSLQAKAGDKKKLDKLAFEDFSSLGMEEYSLTEAEVDELLGERAYPGGDIPMEILDEVDERLNSGPLNLRYFFALAKEAYDFKEVIQSQFLAEIIVESHVKEDWNEVWKKHYAPIDIEGEFKIIPAWLKDESLNSSDLLFINPGMGFGTGGHETTFMCLALFMKGKFQQLTNVLDFGSGSGILGLAVLKKNPTARVDFYDIDPEANKNCYDNARINNLEGKEFRLLLPQVRECIQSSYDLIFANILQNVLLQEAAFLSSLLSKSGHMIISGLLHHQVDEVRLKYESFNLRFVGHMKKNDWSAIYLTKD